MFLYCNIIFFVFLQPITQTHNNMTAETKMLPASALEVNKGQIEGLPKNPRFIRDNRYEQLRKSIEDAPEMLSLRELIVMPHGEKYVVIGGNMRLRACLDLGHKEIPCKVLDKDTPVEKLMEYAIKDNVGFGNDDWDALANEWDKEQLDKWGMELSFMGDIGDIGNFFDEEETKPKNDDNVEIKVILPKELEDKAEDIKRNIELTLADYKGIKIK